MALGTVIAVILAAILIFVLGFSFGCWFEADKPNEASPTPAPKKEEFETCPYCSKVDFKGNMIDVGIIRNGLVWGHKDCYYRAYHIKTCPRCDGKGIVYREPNDG